MNFKEMEYLLAVEQEKNLSKAARTVGISQPAMSKCIYGYLQIPGEYYKLFQ